MCVFVYVYVCVRERKEKGSGQPEGIMACGLTAACKKCELQQETRMEESFKILILEPHYLGNCSVCHHHRTLQLCPKNRPGGLNC